LIHGGQNPPSEENSLLSSHEMDFSVELEFEKVLHDVSRKIVRFF